MVIKQIETPEAGEVTELSNANYPEGFYLSNDQLWIKDKNGVVSFIWSNVRDYFTNPVDAIAPEPQRGDTISEEFLLKVLAVAKQPDLIKGM